MTDLKKVNTDTYWNTRFVEDWETFEGPEQSRFFARIAVESLPTWFMHELKTQALTLADWGCAQGDGTNIWLDHISSQQVTGVDFSSIAIDQATQRYPQLRFLKENWLEIRPEQFEIFDIVFSSNTLEHFHNPYEVLNKISGHAKKAIILALPYKELNRIEEHFSSFFPENIPFTISNGFILIWAQVVNCKNLPETRWSGEQIILMFADPQWINSLELKLNCIKIEHAPVVDLGTHHITMIERDTAIAERNHLALERNTAIANLNAAMLESETAIIERNHLALERDTAIANLNAAMLEKESAIAETKTAIASVHLMQCSLSWQLTKPLRLMKSLLIKPQAYNNNNDPKNQQLKQTLLQSYHNLPLPTSVKKTLSRFRHKIKHHSINKSLQTLVHTPPLLTATNKPLPKSTNSPDFIVWGVIDWYFRHQRPQQLSIAFANNGHRVFYISPNFIDRSNPGFEVAAIDSSDMLFQINLYVKHAPIIYSSAPNQETLDQLRLSIGEMLIWADSQQVISLVQHPFWCDIASALPNSQLVYDCMDHHEGFGNNAESLLQLEKTLLRKAILTITTSTWLDEAVATQAKRHALIRNAGDYVHFSTRPAASYRDPLGRKVIGYYGAIAEWFDVDLIEEIANHHADCSILLIGADTVNAKFRLKKLPNITFTGEMPYDRLPFYLYGFDICILPFKVIPLTLATNPVKAYEYLSAGKPVVSVNLPEMKQFEELVYVAENSENFVNIIGNVLDSSESESLISRRRSFAQEQTWGHRAKEFTQHLKSSIYQDRVSIIVVTYNNLELTRQCLSSIRKYSQYNNLEIIVVDNASTDGSQEFLNTWATEEVYHKLILNNDNKGFAAANNQGVNIASGKYIVLLNNDTHVTPGWVQTLINHLEFDETIGIIGPVTNNIGNEAKIDINYSDMTDMLRKSASYTRHHCGQAYQLRTAAFFCVMMKKDIFMQVGPLDEAFGRGFFEDDDYCRRIENLGLKIVCAEDVFIHHHLSASFNKLKHEDRRRLFEDNKRIYEKKWGKWVPHKSREK